MPRLRLTYPWRLLIVGLLALVVVTVMTATGAWQPFGTAGKGNALVVIAPYKYAGTWVFDDPAVGLHREPFVSGLPAMVDDMVKDIPGADKGFRLLFSAQPFPGYTHELSWRRGDKIGNWYYCPQLKQEGWLCPGLFRYYPKPPPALYAKAEKI